MSTLSVNTTRTPELIAAEINNIKNQTRKIVLNNSIEIGRRLCEAKEILPHGEWGDWLEKSVEYSQRTANNLMKIFEEYGATQITFLNDNLNSQAFASLSYSQAVALLGLPSEDRENFVKENEIDSMSTRELQQAIKEKKELEEQLKNAKDLVEAEREQREVLAESYQKMVQNNKKNFEQSQELKKELEKANKEKEELEQQLQDSIEDKNSFIKKIESYKKKIEEAKSSGNSGEVEKLQAALQETENKLHDSNEKIQELEKQLKEKPIDVITAEPQIIEKVPEEVEKELQELREKISKGSNAPDAATIKFKLYFDELVKMFNDLLGTLNGIKDTEIRDKYKNAVSKLINKMNEQL